MTEKEMTLTLSCQKCGGNIDVPVSVIQEATQNGHPLVFAHQDPPGCPSMSGDDTVLHRFRVFIRLTRVLTVDDKGEPLSEEDLASLGGVVEHRSFTLALPELSRQLSKQWEQISSMGPVIDQGLDAPAQLQGQQNVASASMQAGSDDV